MELHEISRERFNLLKNKVTEHFKNISEEDIKYIDSNVFSGLKLSSININKEILNISKNILNNEEFEVFEKFILKSNSSLINNTLNLKFNEFIMIDINLLKIKLEKLSLVSNNFTLNNEYFVRFKLFTGANEKFQDFVRFNYSYQVDEVFDFLMSFIEKNLLSKNKIIFNKNLYSLISSFVCDRDTTKGRKLWNKLVSFLNENNYIGIINDEKLKIIFRHKNIWEKFKSKLKKTIEVIKA